LADSSNQFELVIYDNRVILTIQTSFSKFEMFESLYKYLGCKLRIYTQAVLTIIVKQRTKIYLRLTALEHLLYFLVYNLICTVKKYGISLYV